MLNRIIRRCLIGGVAALALVVSSGVRADDAQSPIYKSWASHKPGTMVKMKMATEAAGNKTETEMTQTLVDVTPEKCVVEMKTVTMVAGQKIESPAVKTEYPAKGAGAATGAQGAAKPDTKESEETIKVGDKEYKCKVTESKAKYGDNTTTSKVWMCETVPGTMVKMESKTEGSFSSSTKSELSEMMDK